MRPATFLCKRVENGLKKPSRGSRAPQTCDPSPLPLVVQMRFHRIPHHPAKILTLQHVTERKDGRLVRRSRDAHELPYNNSSTPGSDRLNLCWTKYIRSMIDRPTGCCPLPTSHSGRTRASSADQGPRTNLLRLVQRQLTTKLPTVLLKHILTRQALLLHRNSPRGYQI